jgi:serine/threonine protein kinase
MSSADPPKHVWQPPTAEELQTLLPQYEVTLLLGRGGMGVVFKARQKSLNRLVAIKLLPPLEDQDELKLEERFHQEAQTLAHLNHPCIVQIYDFGETVSGQPFFVMEFVDGMDVADLIAAQGQLSVDETLRIIRPVCEALEYAHRRGVIHRDIKPSNVMVDHEGMVKVADFGLAKLQDPAVANNLTRTHVALGTQEFAAPEVFKPGMVVDQRADIYSLGVMLYQMLTGEIPRVMFKLPSLRRPELGTRFDAFVCKALETDPSDRFQTAAEFQQALDAVMVVRPELRQKRTKLRWAPALIALSLMGGMIMAKKATSHVHGGLPLAMPKTGGPAAISLWDTQQKVPKEAAVRWENGAIVLGDAKYKGMLVWSQPRSRDAIFRAELRTNPDAEYAQIRLRYNWTEGPGDFYRLQLHGGMVDLSVSEHGRGREIKAWPLPRADRTSRGR